MKQMLLRNRVRVQSEMKFMNYWGETRVKREGFQIKRERGSYFNI